MKIVHVCLGNSFSDGYSYQENMLAKFHKEQGYDVEVIASMIIFDEKGNLTYYSGPKEYLNEYGIKVTRLRYKFPQKFYKRFRRFEGFEETLNKSEPNIVFVHNCQFMDIDIVAKYSVMHRVTIYVDNHADYSNSARNWLSRNVLHGMIWKHCAHVIEPYTKKFYGVLPARVDFLKEVYNLPDEKCELLVMGADDGLVEAANDSQIKMKVREKYGIKENDFLIMTGGKIDQWKEETLFLMEAVRKIKNDRVRLIVFGSVVPELKEKFNNLVDDNKVQYIGWIQSKDSYQHFAAADLVVFPGRHSVLWEQVAAQGVPMLCKEWYGTKHVDVGGNVLFLKNDSVDVIQRDIEWLSEHPEEYKKMRDVAVREGMKNFSYRNISKRAIEA